MAEILFIKTSSLGDVVHHMPAVTDARRRLPDARLSWVVEEPYAPLARLHPGVDEVIPVASRRWRLQLHRPETWSEIGRFRRAIRERRYDAVVDSQGLLRTALIAKAARGVRHGYDAASIREPLASVFYDVRHRVEWRCHAIPRNRMLTGRALGYEPQPQIDFGLDRASHRRQRPQRLRVADPRDRAGRQGMAAIELARGGARAGRARSRHRAAMGGRRRSAGAATRSSPHWDAARSRSAGRSMRWRR